MFGSLRGWWERGRKYPSEGWVVSANEEARYTPDLCEIEASQMQLLFLPCELQKAHEQSRLISDEGTCLFNAFTLGRFSLYRNREDNSAIFLGEERHRVKGELWAIPSSFYSVLDKHKENGIRCQRKRIDLLVPYSRISKDPSETITRLTIHKLSAWAYEGLPEYWDAKLDGGYQYPTATLYRPHNPFLNSFYFYHVNDRKK